MTGSEASKSVSMLSVLFSSLTSYQNGRFSINYESIKSDKSGQSTMTNVSSAYDKIFAIETVRYIER